MQISLSARNEQCYCRMWGGGKAQMCSKNTYLETSLVIQWLRLRAPNAGGPGLILGQRNRPHMLQLRVHLLQLKIPNVATKTQCSQINKYLKSKQITPTSLSSLPFYDSPLHANYSEDYYRRLPWWFSG